jgi:hypothetical protein
MRLTVPSVFSTVCLLAVGGLAGCAADEPRSLELARAPYMGVACRVPNSIACDRVGLAVWLKKPAHRLTASIAGRNVTMRSPGSFVAGRGTGWEGYLHPAGVRQGPLEVRPDRGTDYWAGRRPVYAPVRITAYFRDGTSASRVVRVRLNAGWG